MNEVFGPLTEALLRAAMSGTRARRVELVVPTYHRGLTLDETGVVRPSLPNEPPETKSGVYTAPIVGPTGEVGWLTAIAESSGRCFSSGEVECLSQLASLMEAELDRIEEASYLTEAAASLAAAERAAEVANRDLAQFAYVASHELVAPLRAVSAFAQLLVTLLGEVEAAGQTDSGAARARMEQCVFEIMLGTSNMQRQLTALLDLSRLAESIEDTEPTELRAVVNAAIDSLAESIEASGATVTVSELGTARVHFVHLQSVFRNLIENAIRYRHPDRQLEISIDSTIDEVASLNMITVSDTGIGIEEGDRARIFGLFERADTTTDGSGIGLALSQRIIRSHGGEIGVDDSDGSGSRFWLTLPLV
ncbi:MAG: HAMP domain-containing sensor histidine kinase [Acidimicrobiales bacterium]